MTGGLNIDPEALRELAQQHYQIANQIRTWSEPPYQWLADFQRTYGVISDPVHKALNTYFTNRQQAGLQLAGSHDGTGDALNAAANSYEQTDSFNAAAVLNAGNGGGAAGMPAAGAAPSLGDGSGQGSPAAGGSGGAGQPQAGGSTGPLGPRGPVPPGGFVPGIVPQAERGSAGAGSSGTAAARGADEDGLVGSGAAGASARGDAADRSARGAAPGGVSAPIIAPPPVPVSLDGIAAAAAERDAEPSYVVGAEPDTDLALARAVLSGLLGVVESGVCGSSVVGVGWGVGVFRGVSGVGVFVCSNEGRGWLPAGVFLPVGVSVPWVWGVVGGVGLGWEGCGDVVRVLVEFGRVWGPVAGARLTAVVSSGGVDVGLVGEGVSVEGFVGPSVGVGGLVLGVSGVGVVDRLGLVGGDVGWVDGVGAGELVSRCVGLGWDVHVRVGGLGVGEALGVRGVRERVLGVLRSGGVVGDGLWDELRDGDVLLGVLVGSLRVDVSGVGLGELRFDEVGSRRLRGLVFERRCNELVLLLRGGCSRQVLRDVVYAYGQVVDHPLFDTDLAAATATVSAPTTVAPAALAPARAAVPSATAAGGDEPVAVRPPERPEAADGYEGRS